MAKRLMRGAYGLGGVLLVLLCAGCFRSASEEDIPSETIPLTDVNAQAVDALATPGDALPPITLIAPPTEIPAQSAESLPDAAAQDSPALTMVMIELPTSTPEPTLDAAPTLALPTITLQIITPGVSLGQLTPDATLLPTRTPVPDGAATPLPGVETTDEAGAVIESDPISADGCIYTIEAGDSLYSIAISQDTTIAAMLAANPDLEDENAILQIDQELNLPACIPGLNVEETEEALAGDTTEEAPEGSEVYIVQSGDVLGAIASRFGVTVRAIVQANNLTNPDSLSVGQRLIIPAAGG